MLSPWLLELSEGSSVLVRDFEVKEAFIGLGSNQHSGFGRTATFSRH